MRYPDQVLLVTFDVHADRIDEGLEATSVLPVEAFDTNAIIGRRFETVIVCWTSLYHSRQHYDEADDLETRKRLIDWINTVVCPRIPSGRRPIWL
jgi:hypothetical protein